MLVQIIRLKSKLPEKELLIRAKEREPSFKALSGLLQKYYVRLEAEYEILEPPTVETLGMLFKLRD